MSSKDYNYRVHLRKNSVHINKKNKTIKSNCNENFIETIQNVS